MHERRSSNGTRISIAYLRRKIVYKRLHFKNDFYQSLLILLGLPKLPSGSVIEVTLILM